MVWNPDKYLKNVFSTIIKQEVVGKGDMEILIMQFCGVSKTNTINNILKRWIRFGYLKPTKNVYIFEINHNLINNIIMKKNMENEKNE